MSTIKERLNWLENWIGLMADGGTWFYPEAQTIYQVYKERKVVKRLSGPGDSEIEKLFKLLGFALHIGA